MFNFAHHIALTALLVLISSLSIAAPGGKKNTDGGTTAAATAAPDVYAVKVDYVNGFIIVEGDSLDPASAGGTIAGIALPDPHETSSDQILKFAFTDAIAAAVDSLGSYVINISTDGGNFTLTAFIPFALVVNPTPPPPGELCPCSNEWDQVSSASSPSGFSEQTPYCFEDSGDWVTVQYYDQPANNYWVLWTDWNGSDGYCELYIDGTYYDLTSQEQFDACANYLRDVVTVWGNQGKVCLF